MGEPEALKAIKEGFIDIRGDRFKIEKHPKGWCDGCYFDTIREGEIHVCPDMARHVCCTGGNILKLIDTHE